MERQSVIRISLAVFIAVVVGLGFIAVPQAFADKGACRDDVAKFCKDVQPGEGRMIKCMKEHEKDLSPGCKANMAEMEKKHHEGREDCKNDMAKFCKDVQPGEGRIIKCMKEHEKDLSPGCRANMAEMQKKHHEAREECKDDVMKFCSDVKPGEGRFIHCLKEHEKELSPKCKSNLPQHQQHQHRNAN
jgi:hypothetical protein